MFFLGGGWVSVRYEDFVYIWLGGGVPENLMGIVWGC